MTFEARLAFLIAFFLLWTFIALIPWSAAAVLRRGEGAAMALPPAILGAWAAAILVPVLGQRDLTGLYLSNVAALLGSLGGTAGGMLLARRLSRGHPRATGFARGHLPRKRRPAPSQVNPTAGEPPPAGASADPPDSRLR